MAYIHERQTSKGEKSYRVQIRMKGYAPASATFKRRTDAIAWARETEVAMQQGRYFKSAAARKHTVKDLIDRYLMRLQVNNPCRYPEVSTILRWWSTELGVRLLTDFSSSVISEKVDKLTAHKRVLKDGRVVPRTPARVNRYLAALSHACTVAMDEWEWLESNPVRSIKKLREPSGRVRYLNDQERARLFEACRIDPALYRLVVLAMSTGMRQGELVNLRWSNIDLQRHTITLLKTKNGERRTVPLAGHALDLLTGVAKLEHADTDLLFPGPRTKNKPWKFRFIWEAAVKAAGLKDFRFHDLRHCAASYLAMNGASALELQSILGHKTLQMVNRYAHLSDAHTHQVVSSMNEKLFGHA